MARFAGFVVENNRQAPSDLIRRMGKALAIDPAYRLAEFEEKGMAVSVCDPAIFPDALAEVVWNADHSRCIVLSGEIFDYQSRKKELIEQGHQFRYSSGSNAGAEFMLHLYEVMGDDFALEINGSFAAAIYDTQSRELRLVNGRLGVPLLYYAQHNGRLIFGSSVASLLADPQLPRAVNSTAIAELLSYEYALNQKTLIESVTTLPPASLLIWREGTITLRHYWQLRFAESTELKRYPEYLGQLIALLRQSLKRQLPADLPAGINLSGGFDSRVALGLLNEQRNQMDLHAYTFGIPGCDDVRIAKELTHTVKVAHKVYELQPDYLIGQAELGVRLTDGMESCVHMHALANVSAQAKDVKILYTGYILDSIISPDANETWLAHYNDNDAASILYGDIRAGFRNAELSTIFSDSFWQKTEPAYKASFHEAMEGSRQFLLSDWQNRFELLQRQRRFTQFGNELLNHQVLCRTPFADKDLIEFCLTLPPGHRLDRKILRDIITRCFPKLAKVPLDKTGYPLMPCGRELMIRTREQLKWLLVNQGLLQKKEKPLRPYADYNLWMRNELRSWVGKILLDKRTLDRGYLQPLMIQKLVNEHMNGEKYAKELGMLISIELWHRMYLD